MTLKTFNINKEVYEEYSRHCKKNGISMSKQVENFLKKELEWIKSASKMDARSEEHPLRKYC